MEKREGPAGELSKKSLAKGFKAVLPQRGPEQHGGSFARKWKGRLKKASLPIKKPSSLTGKILMVSLPLIIAVSILFWCPSIHYMERAQLDQAIKTARSQSGLIKSALIYDMLKNRRDGIYQTLRSIAKADNFMWLRVDDMNYKVRYSSNRKEINKDLCSGAPKYVFTGRPWDIQTVGGKRVLSMFTPIPNMRPCYTAACHRHLRSQKTLGVIELGYALAPMDMQIRTQGRMIAIFGFVFISALSVLLYFIIRRFVLKPLAALTEGVRMTSYENLSQGVEIETRDEIGVLARSFSVMTEELREKREAAQKELDEYKASLLQAQKMEAIGALAAGIAHDFNNLLTGIIGYAEIARLQSSEQNVRENTGMVVNTARKAAQLTRQILLIGRKVPPEQKPTEIPQFLGDSMKILRRMVEENIELEVSVSSGLPLVYIDPSQMTQVLMNLVVNARDAMPHGGKISINIREFRCDEEYCRHNAYARPGHFVLMSVSDTGPGVPQEAKHRIFEPFYTTKEPGKGTGLGLAVTHSIVVAHGGWIDLYSEEGRGARFNIYLPVLEKPAVSEKTAEQESYTGGTGTVMIVDDEPLVREIGCSMLRELGYNVVSASSGAEAIEIYRAKRDEIELVIMDNIMPGMDGVSAARCLKQIDPSVGVVLSSGYAADAQDLKDKSLSGFLSKPYSLGEVAKTVRETVKGKRDPAKNSRPC